MYHTPRVTHGFNHQSLYRQPISNLRQINEIVWNQNNETQQIGDDMPHSISNQQYDSKYTNLENSLAKNLSQMTRTDNPFIWPIATGMTSSTNQHRLLSRQSSLGSIPETNLSYGTVPLSNSRSAGSIDDYIQKERRAHTMAPLARITGPSSTLTANTFARTTAPSDAQIIRSSHLTQAMPNTIFNSYSQPGVERTDVVDDNNQQEEEEDDEDDDAPIIVKVRYDPDAGGPPSEDTIRQAVDNQLNRQSGPRMTNDPIVLDFLNHATQPKISQILSRPQQPAFNRSPLSIPQVITRPHHQIPISPQQRQYQHQQLLQQQQRQQQLKQQQLQLQEKQRQQQQQQMEQQQQLQLQENQRQQRLKEELLLKQQKQQYQLQQFLKQQQERQDQQAQLEQYQLQQFLKQQQERQDQQEQLEQQQIQQQIKAEKNQIQQLIQQQIQLERQQQQQQKYRQFMQQQKQQREQQIYQQQQYSSLPPMGPRPLRTVPSNRPIPVNQSPAMVLKNSKIHLPQPFPLAPMPLRNPQQISNYNLQRLPNRNANSPLASSLSSTGLDAYSNYFSKYTPNIFAPIQIGVPTRQRSVPINNSKIHKAPQNLLQRSHTASTSTEMFRPPSASDIPELSKENLRNMLDQIPTLHGRRFNIEYVEPAEPVSYPVPSQSDGANNTYPEAVVVDQLPNNIIQHVRSSNNLALKAELDPTIQSEKKIQPTTQSQAVSSKSLKTSSKVLRHTARPKKKVRKSRPASSDDADSTTQTSTSEEETEVEEIEIEIISLSKY